MVVMNNLFDYLDDSVHVFCQRQLIEQSCHWLKCHTKGDELYCSGKVRAADNIKEYEIFIYYKSNVPPLVWVKKPNIKYHDDIHIYKKSNSLCLYYPPDMPWGKHIMLAYTIVQWIPEWIILYELWKISGKWEGPEVRH